MLQRELSQNVIEDVKKYYGKVLKGNKDLKTSACCSTSSLSKMHREILKEINAEIKDKFYGCGSPIPQELTGRTVLDLGCGTGRDVYLASKIVGPKGSVIGIDMTEQQLEVANRHIEYQTKIFGFKHPNVQFIHGFIEDLKTPGIKDNSVDVVISNCVINLSPNKELVFKEIFRVLKPGGELYFSDIFSNQRVPEELKKDPLLRGECLSGAMYIEDFRRMMLKYGCSDYRTIETSQIDLLDEEVTGKIGNIGFCSITIRAFKLPDLEDICEDYGQLAIYAGTIPGNKHSLSFDKDHTFITGKPLLVCGNTASMLKDTRFASHFTVTGDQSTHYGPFDCHPAHSKAEDATNSGGGACC